ncbi:hypothetical protein ABWL39_14090 [Chitinivorax sp. PXF-14]|uniref:hypothetical protein n=1 Tax=Chitinivorax sp. PXF-14 TaxID=3230488 RepID=UPI0034658994
MLQRLLAFLLLLCCLSGVASGQELSFTLAGVDHPMLKVRDISAKLDWRDKVALTARIGELGWQGKTWRNARFDCPDMQIYSAHLSCPAGRLDVGEPIRVRFDYWPASQKFSISLAPKGEQWQASGQLTGPQAALLLDFKGARLARLGALLPADMPKPSQGRVDGRLRIGLAARQPATMSGRLTLRELAFADASGLHAGDKLAATLDFDASRQNTGWRWQGRLDWHSGELFWNPLYLAGGGHALNASGRWGEAGLAVEHAELRLADVGLARASLAWQAGQGLQALNLDASDVALGPLYQLFKPLLAGTALADLAVAGRGDLSLAMASGQVTRADIALRDADIVDNQQRFLLKAVNAHLPWRLDAPTEGEITMAGGELLKLALGATRIPLRLNGWQADIERAVLAVLDGRLEVHDFHAEKAGEAWQWRFQGALEPISMPRLSAALGWPAMKGQLAGTIPRVAFADQTLTIDGALQMQVFDGTVELKDLRLYNPLGIPTLSAELDMRRLDLGLLTDTFSFGNIQGRLDAHVAGLELSNWQPLRFDAWLRSSPGDYPRKISQKAVQNISALGGGGAVAAVQKSLLRVFENFRYSQLGLSCRLQNGVCHMDGVEPAPGGYVIVKGGGLPAITVMGYNRQVDWQDLLDRLKRITQDNLSPVVK